MGSELFERVLTVLEEISVGTHIHLEQQDDDFVIRNMDSLKFIHFVVALEEEFNVEIPDEKLLFTEMNTMRKIQALIKGELRE